MRRYNQILYADQTRSEEKFYGVDHAPCPGRNFGDTNADARSVPVANLHVLTCAGTQSLSPDLTPRRFLRVLPRLALRFGLSIQCTVLCFAVEQCFTAATSVGKGMLLFLPRNHRARTVARYRRPRCSFQSL